MPYEGNLHENVIYQNFFQLTIRTLLLKINPRKASHYNKILCSSVQISTKGLGMYASSMPVHAHWNLLALISSVNFQLHAKCKTRKVLPWKGVGDLFIKFRNSLAAVTIDSFDAHWKYQSDNRPVIFPCNQSSLQLMHPPLKHVLKNVEKVAQIASTSCPHPSSNIYSRKRRAISQQWVHIAFYIQNISAG